LILTILSALALGAGTLPQALGQEYGLTQRPSVSPYLDGKMPTSPPVIDANWSTVKAFPNLTFLNALGILPIPGTNKLVVWEREGRVYAFENNPAVSTKTPALDIHQQCQGWDDCGLLGLAFHPNFATNHYVYIWYNWVTPGTVLGSSTARPPNTTSTHQRLVRYTVDPATGIFDPASEYIVLEQKDHNLWHNGGGMFFHPDDGFLYLTNGNDADGGNDQKITGGLFGCVIRIDVDKRGGTTSHPPTKRPFEEIGPNWPGSYYIPNDNPFVGVAGANEEIYALGLRSPHRMTIDPLTRRVFIGDVGEGAREELDTIEPNDPSGLNFQWHTIEGYNGDLTPPYAGINRRPLLDYQHGEDGFAIIGGYIYRGSQFPELAGKYLFADNVSNRIWLLDESTHTATTPAKKTLLATMPKGSGPSSGADYTGISSFGYDAAGEIYLCQLSSLGGYIFKLQRGGPPPAGKLPPTLSETGVFSDLATLTPSNKLIPYNVISPLWSDGAVKSRWAVVPSETNIGFKATGEWTWPEGTVFVKHFELPVDDSNPAARKRLETRLLVKMASGAVYGATYKWRADNSDADLMDGALTENVPVQIAPPGSFVGADIGAPALTGSTARSGDELEVTAGGSDIQGTADQGHFAYQQRTGDFDLSVRIASLTEANLYTKAGLMARESLAPGSRGIFALVFPSNASRNNNDGGYEFQYRSVTNGGTSVIYPPSPKPRVNYPNTWLRLQREGDVFTASSSEDGVWWSEIARQAIDLPETVYFGAAVTSHAPDIRATAKFHLQTSRIQPWYYPSRVDCMTCHTAASGGVLGPKTRQLNADYTYPGNVTDNQIRAWAHIGLFDSSPSEEEIPSLRKLVSPGDISAPLESRARSYLDANCAGCHRPGGVNALWDARFDTPINQQGLLYGPVVNNLGDPLARVVFPGSEQHSVLYQRVSVAGGGIQMPPLAKNMVDEKGVEVIRAWLSSLQTNVPPIVRLTAPASGSLFLSAEMPVTLRASANDTEGISRVEFYDGDTLIGTDASAPYEFEWFSSWLGSHYLTAVAVDRGGTPAVSPVVTAEVQSAYLPQPLEHRDIGNVGVVGDAIYDDDGSFAINASGSDIWGTTDMFHFVYRKFTGDGEVIARVVSLGETDPWAKAGVMFRETLEPGARYGFAAVTPGNGATFQARTDINANAVEVNRAGGVSAPRWVRLVRSGNQLRAYHSTNGRTWTQYGPAQTVSMNATVYAGIAVSSHKNAALTQLAVDHLAFISADSPTVDLDINFQPVSSPVPEGYVPDSGLAFGVRPSGLTYGWDVNRPLAPQEVSGGPDSLHNTSLRMGNAGSGAKWEIQVPNTRYSVRIVAGDPAAPNGTQHLTVEGQNFMNGATSSQTPFLDQTADVEVTDGRLTVALGASAVNTKICFIQIKCYEVAANIMPKVILTKPYNGAHFANPTFMTLEAGASDSDGAIARVEFLVDNVKVGEDSTAPYSFAWNSPEVGIHEVVARAVDTAGGSSASPTSLVTVKIENDPPVVALIEPDANSSVLPEDDVAMSADAGDNDGEVVRVEFWADGNKLGERTTAPYLWTWPGPHAVGIHTLRAVAYDNGGANSESSVITVESKPLTLALGATGSGNAVGKALEFTVPTSRNWVVEWSADLVHWNALQSGVGSGVPVKITDDDASDVPARFYRLRLID
jgi:glucose/arabinose dehydrogenase/regulation of enolase protein 1 (concanavalin A-like superfamily)